MENYITTDAVVLSISHVNMRLDDATKASNTTKHPASGGIVPSVARVHRLFEDILRNGNSMQKAYSEMADVVLKIRIQKVVFDNGCKPLLVTAARSRQDVENMIENPSHSIWKDKIAHQKLDTVMGRFAHLCLKALERFQECLYQFKMKSDASKGLWKMRRKRLFLANRPTCGTIEDFSTLVQSVRNCNDIFCTLVWQVVPCPFGYRSGMPFGLSSGEGLGYSHAIKPAQASCDHVGCIQRASRNLYETLSSAWKCHDHEVYSLNISLKFEYAKAGAIFRDKAFQFNVAVTSPYFCGPYHLVINAAHRDFCVYLPGNKNRSSKQILAENRVAGPATRTEVSDFSELDGGTVTHEAEGLRSDTLTGAGSLQMRIPNLGVEEDICYRLRKSSVTMKPKNRTECSCLGSVEARNNLPFLFSDVAKEEYWKQSSCSLDDVLVRANSEHRALSLEYRLRLAFFLANSVRHYHTTPWLGQAWSSKDIHFFDMNGCEGCALGEPFLQTQLDIDTARGPVYEVKNPSTTRLCLLSLGLVLIELAFSAPWRKLQLQENIIDDLLEWEGNLLNLMRLSDTVSRELGSRYAKVVQTCLFQGWEAKEMHDLGEAELDEVIFEDIVRELDRCLEAVTFKSVVNGSPGVSRLRMILRTDQYLTMQSTPVRTMGLDLLGSYIHQTMLKDSGTISGALSVVKSSSLRIRIEQANSRIVYISYHHLALGNELAIFNLRPTHTTWSIRHSTIYETLTKHMLIP